MEPPEHPISPHEAELTLADADAILSRMAQGLLLPSYFYSSLGVAIAVQIGVTAVALADNGSTTWVWLIGGLAVFSLVASVQLARFRRMNGVWLGGLASRVVLGTANLTSTAYVLAFVGSQWAAYAGLWWLVAVFSVAGGGAYAWCGRRWWREYQGDPAARRQRDTVAWVLVIPVVVVAGIALVVVGR